jgi:transcriptional regulator with XRE-family HTH domain
LASLIDVAPNTVSDWMTGKTHPRHDKLESIASALSTTVPKLVA